MLQTMADHFKAFHEEPDYLSRRARQEVTAAVQARHPAPRVEDLTLAQLYEVQLDSVASVR
jgi:hypothetical protein